MPKYKNIKSVAHNLGHSFLSDMNSVGSGRAFTMVADAIYQAAKAAQVPVVRIDLISGTIEPSAIETKPIREAVAHYRRRLPELAVSQSVEPRMIRHATLTLQFDLTAGRPGKYYPEREIPKVEALVEIFDDRGTRHEAHPTNWPYD